MALTLNLEAGYTGIPNFGKLLFFAGGASIAGSVSSYLSIALLNININNIGCPEPTYYYCQSYMIGTIVNPALAHNLGLSIVLLIVPLIVGAVVGAGLGYLLSYPVLKLREDYLGMLLLASSQFFPYLLENYNPIINGENGVFTPNPFSAIGGQTLLGTVIFLVIAGGVFLYAERTVRSPLGRVLRATRDHEEASEALGKNTITVRRNMLIIASAITGLVGAYYAVYIGAVQYLQFFGSPGRTQFTFWPWVIMMMGGAANNVGVTYGAVTFSFLFTAILQVKQAIGQIPLPYLNFGNFSVAYFPVVPDYLAYIFFGVLLIVILLVKPDGLIPEKWTATISRSRIRELIRSTSSTEPSSGVVVGGSETVIPPEEK